MKILLLAALLLLPLTAHASRLYGGLSGSVGRDNYYGAGGPEYANALVQGDQDALAELMTALVNHPQCGPYLSGMTAPVAGVATFFWYIQVSEYEFANIKTCVRFFWDERRRINRRK